jgi:glycosyltransferase involved in cell wall biosynthesis
MISIVVPTYNRFNSLVRLVHSIEDSFRFGNNYLNQVIIVDDGSSDKTKDYSNRNENIKIIHIKNKGPSFARNVGFSFIQSDFVLFLDDDCVVTPSFAKSVFNHLFNNQFDLISSPAYSIKSNNIISRYLNAIKFLHNPCYDSLGELSCLPSSNLIVRSITFNDIGGFDTNFELPGGEDNQFSIKAIKKEYSLNFDRSMNIYHDNDISLSAFIKKYYQYGKGNSINKNLSKVSNEDSMFWAESYYDLLLKSVSFIRYTQKEQFSEFSESKSFFERMFFRLLAFIRILTYELGGLKNATQSSRWLTTKW